jgi:peptidyl-prolyl cis-trans isomerase SurA
MKKIKSLNLILMLALWAGLLPAGVEVIDEVYAVINNEAITLSDLKRAEFEQSQYLQGQLKGEELQQGLQKMRAGLLNTMIEQRLISSHARGKNYNVDGDVDILIKEIMKNNNIASDADLRKALASEGLKYEEWRTSLHNQRINQRFIQDEVGAKIKIDNPEIVEYYRKNLTKYTIPPDYTLDAIFLKKENTTADALTVKRTAISAEITPANFDATAKANSDLFSEENGARLGKFKKGEMQKELEEAVRDLKKDELTGWIEAETGWYLVKLVERSEQKLMEYKDVRDDIQRNLQDAKMVVKMREYLEELKKDSIIRIVKEYKQE